MAGNADSEPALRAPWLVAAWPGMGGVAQIAGNHLVRQLRAAPFAEVDPGGFFEPRSITVKDGLVRPEALPRTVLHSWRNPGAERDLLLLLGEQQPAVGAFGYAQALLEGAMRHGIRRVVTFAAMATPIHPSADPRVFGVATDQGLLDELKRHGVTALEGGEISGLNGVFLAAATARAIPGVCLLGEFPFFAAQLPNPKASAAVLDVFSRLFGLTLDLGPLRQDAAEIERRLVRHLEEAQRAAEGGEGTDAEEAPAEPAAEAPAAHAVPPEAIERIESLFDQARRNRSKALELKAELDRHGLFRKFEDRFLDLFKEAG
jgi:proteasome assembly chaperone (PAC2) family protein